MGALDHLELNNTEVFTDTAVAGVVTVSGASTRRTSWPPKAGIWAKASSAGVVNISLWQQACHDGVDGNFADEEGGSPVLVLTDTDAHFIPYDVLPAAFTRWQARAGAGNDASTTLTLVDYTAIPTYHRGG